MAKSSEILSQRQTIRSIRTVTKAMETVATTRFKKSQGWAVSAKPYTSGLAGLADDIIAPSNLRDPRHPLLRAHRDLRRNIILVLTSNRGLCGDYNSNVLSVALRRQGRLVQAGYDVPLHVVGKTGVDRLDPGDRTRRTIHGVRGSGELPRSEPAGDRLLAGPAIPQRCLFSAGKP